MMYNKLDNGRASSQASRCYRNAWFIGLVATVSMLLLLTITYGIHGYSYEPSRLWHSIFEIHVLVVLCSWYFRRGIDVGSGKETCLINNTDEQARAEDER